MEMWWDVERRRTQGPITNGIFHRTFALTLEAENTYQRPSVRRILIESSPKINFILYQIAIDENNFEVTYESNGFDESAVVVFVHLFSLILLNGHLAGKQGNHTDTNCILCGPLDILLWLYCRVWMFFWLGKRYALSLPLNSSQIFVLFATALFSLGANCVSFLKNTDYFGLCFSPIWQLRVMIGNWYNGDLISTKPLFSRTIFFNQILSGKIYVYVSDKKKVPQAWNMPHITQPDRLKCIELAYPFLAAQGK